MQVRKFEAKTMKEALEMVKTQLGPEAIILSARDNSKSHGLIGQKSVEVTAAVSESGLNKKLLAEQKLTKNHKEIFQRSPAKLQRRFINQSAREVDVESTSLRPHAPTQQRYADILDQQPKTVASTRIRAAARLALEAGQETLKKQPQDDVQALKNEIQNLKSLLEKFQNIPQNFINLHPGADLGLPFELSGTFEKLRRAGLSDDNTAELLKASQKSLSATDIKKPSHVEAWVVKYLLDNLTIVDNFGHGRYQVFVGPAGQGKTSSLVKLASHMVIHEKKKIAVVTTDVLKVGAAEQLKIYAQILNVPFAVIKQPSDWTVVTARLQNYDAIFVDCPGLILKNANESQWLIERLPPVREGVRRNIHFVQSVLAKDKDAFEIADRYRTLHFNDAIFTSLDESTQHGLIYNFQKRFATPLHSFGIGPQMPEDFEFASKERLIDLIFKISKFKKGRTSA